MRFIVRVLAARDGSLPEDELLRLISPLGLTEAIAEEAIAGDSESGETSGLKTGGRTIAEKSLAALRGVGAVQQSRAGDRSVTLSPDVQERFPTWKFVTAPAFAEFLLRGALASVNGPTTSADDESSGGAEDLASAVALLLSMPDPLAPIVAFENADGKLLASYQADQLGQDTSRWIIRNRERYASLVRWVPYLGFGRLLKGELVVDPSDALRTVALPLLDREMPVVEFLHSAARTMPYLDGGLVGSGVSATLSLPTEDGAVSPGLALGLRVLALRNEVRLTPKSDAESLAFPIHSANPLRFSHISPGERT
jgi:hypothetical protein